MAFVNSIATYSGQGYEYQSVLATVVTTAGSPQTVRCPAGSAVFSPAVTRGLWRCKVYNETSAVTLTNMTFQGSDGTNTVNLDNFVPVQVGSSFTISATAWVDHMGSFISDTSTAGGGATGTTIFGGFTFFNVILNVATGSGSASADVEVVAAP